MKLILFLQSKEERLKRDGLLSRGTVLLHSFVFRRDFLITRSIRFDMSNNMNLHTLIPVSDNSTYSNSRSLAAA
jgi:hypothetical protein